MSFAAERNRRWYAVKNLRGYFRTLKNYFRTPKARHDFKDYARAVTIIFLTSLIIFLFVIITSE
ncbi:MAG: hypothetical protein IJ685_08325 [Selenomonadaceae bacterium]|nr:hypothetical protein [Selenomonadaceae bacterium]